MTKIKLLKLAAVKFFKMAVLCPPKIDTLSIVYYVTSMDALEHLTSNMVKLYSWSNTWLEDNTWDCLTLDIARTNRSHIRYSRDKQVTY